jgi:hypothetical protein
MEGLRIVEMIGPLNLWDTEGVMDTAEKDWVRQKNREQIEIALTSEGEDPLGKPAPPGAPH